MPSDADDTRRWLADIQYHAALAENFTRGMAYADFLDDLRTTYAAIRCLEIVSEASRRLPDALKAKYPEIAWRAMAAAGNVYRHDYEDVAASAVWRTLTHDLPALRDVVARELAALDQAT
jgi:uncharacterized protein with HEPN domain